MTPNRHPDAVKIDNLRLVAEDAEALLKKILSELEVMRGETRQQIQYCCEQPDLRWNGDEDYPGVACVNCDFTVAENGQLVTYTPEELEEITHAKERQKSLFDDSSDEA